MTTTPTKITGGIDVGNGYVKVALRGPASEKADRFDIPSGVAQVMGAVDLPTPDSAAAEVVGGDFYDELDLTFATALVGSTNRHLFGKRALHAQTPRFEEFDVVSGLSKAEQSLSKVLVLGIVAAKALRDHVAVHGSLPEGQLDVEAHIALALPIDEYRDHRVSYAESFKAGTHLVTVHNFETPVSVRVRFVSVHVAAEGASAQFAIRELGVKLVESMLKDLRAQGEPLEGLTGQDVYEATSTVGIDIGEGTVNFPVYSAKKFNGDSSRTFDKGFGTVLNNALPVLRRAKTPFTSRKALADYLLQTPSAMKRAEHAKVAAIVAEQSVLFSEQVAEEFRKIFAEVGRDTEVVYVFGGGAGSVRASLHPLLLAAVPEGFPVLFLDSRYSRHLNREGLLIAATRLAEAEAAAAAESSTAPALAGKK